MITDWVKTSLLMKVIKIQDVYAGILNSESGSCSAFCMDKFKLEIPYKDLIIDLDKSARYGYSVDTIIIPASNFYTQGNSELSKLSSQNNCNK